MRCLVTLMFSSVRATFIQSYRTTGWIGLAVVSGIRTGKVDSWPAENYTMNDPLHPKRFISRGAADT